MLAADTDGEVRVNLACCLGRHPHQSSHPTRIQRVERVAREYLRLDVVVQELALRVVPAERERHLRQVVRAEREELRLGGYLVRRQCRARHLDHRPEQVRHVYPQRLARLAGDRSQAGPEPLQFVHVRDDGDHDLRSHRRAFLGQAATRRYDGPHLHLVDLRHRQAHTAATVSQHRVGLPKMRYEFERSLLLLQLRPQLCFIFLLGE